MPTENRYEMLWDCSRCETPKLLGLSHRNCPSCGSPQDPTTRYFPKDEDKVAVDDHPFVGADKACGGCDAPNAQTAQFCVGCGASLEGAGPVIQRDVQSDQSGAFAADTSKAATAEQRAKRTAAHEEKTAPVAPSKSGGSGLVLGGLAGGLTLLILLAMCAGIGVMLWKKEAAVAVTGHTWSREIAVEAFTAVADSAWKEAVPVGARNVSCAQAERSTTKVPDGQDCHNERKDNGDGTFTEQQKCDPKFKDQPVYDQKCAYTQDRWVAARAAKAAGSALAPAPAWPTANIGATEREGARSEKYTVTFTESAAPDGRVLTCDVAESEWLGLAVGSRWKAPVGVLSSSIDCSALQPAG
ncbi:MAG: hypothetical protein EXR69_06840 [Myxococcales bacterium]|nr:hypothetical protein [Myxococcales bacterium]